MRGRSRAHLGAMYLAVLMTATIVAVIGMSALATTRIRLRSTEGGHDVNEARFCAQSAVEMGMTAVVSNPTWRSKYTHNVWTAEQTLGNGSFAWKFVDEKNGNLLTDIAAPVRLHGRGTAGDAVRTYSVLLEYVGADAPNLFACPGAEPAVTGWTGYYCTIVPDGSDRHGGLQSLKALNRSNWYGGPAQTFTDTLENGVTYDVEAWVKMTSGTALAQFIMYVRNTVSDTWWSFEGSVPVNDTVWTRVTAQLTPTWTGTFQDALIAVATHAGTTAFLADDFMLRAADQSDMEAEPGSWRRVVNDP